MLKTVSSVANALGALNYKGTWDASTNTPALASGVGTQGDYYVVSVDGTTDLDGITNWGVGDWAAFNGSVWQRVEGGADGNFVNLDVTGGMTVDTSTLVVDDASNRVGIGTTTPQDLLHITLPSGVNGDIIALGRAANSYQFHLGMTSSSMFYIADNASDIKVGFPYTGGITFNGDTAAANALDDYEEGDWTPAYTPTTGTFTTITTVATGRYTKVGRLVTVFGAIRTSGTLDVTGASGNIKITGLPFACNATIAGGGADISHQLWNLGTDILNTRMSVAAGASEILMYLNTMNGSSFPSGNITVADMSTSGGSFANLISFTASYEV